MRKVLVLLSTYNGEKYLPELLDSLKEQQGVDVSVLARDDGSNDGTLEILKMYESVMQLKYYTGANLHATGSFLELIKSAENTYDYYAFCDQDDYWEPDKLIHAVEKLEEIDIKYPALYYSGQKVTDERLNLLYEHKLDTGRSIRSNFVFHQMAGCTAVLNKTLLKFLQMFPQANPPLHDTYVYRLCAALGGKIIVESKGYIKYRQHGNNVVGLDYSLKGKMQLLKKHLNSVTARRDSEEILKGYESILSDDWIPFLKCFSDSKKSIPSKFKLLTNRELNFHSAKLRLIYIIKIVSGKY